MRKSAKPHGTCRICGLHGLGRGSKFGKMKPEWATKAFYKILDTKSVHSSNSSLDADVYGIKSSFMSKKLPPVNRG